MATVRDSCVHAILSLLTLTFHGYKSLSLSWEAIHASGVPVRLGITISQKKFRRVKGYRELQVLHRRMNPSLTQQAQVA